jgi:hypothetical protein
VCVSTGKHLQRPRSIGHAALCPCCKRRCAGLLSLLCVVTVCCAVAAAQLGDRYASERVTVGNKYLGTNAPACAHMWWVVVLGVQQKLQGSWPQVAVYRPTQFPTNVHHVSNAFLKCLSALIHASELVCVTLFAEHVQLLLQHQPCPGPGAGSDFEHTAFRSVLWQSNYDTCRNVVCTVGAGVQRLGDYACAAACCKGVTVGVEKGCAWPLR